MQSFAQFMELLNDTWIERFGLNTTREHDLDDALFGYDTMWLAALAMDLAEAGLQNMTPSLTLGDFQYTGEKSSRIKDAIYRSGLEVSFTGASVSSGLHKHCIKYNILYYTYSEYRLDRPYHRALSSSSPMETELHSCDIFSIGFTVKVKVNDFLFLTTKGKFGNLIQLQIIYLSVGLRRQEIGELDEHDNLIISSQVLPVFAGK